MILLGLSVVWGIGMSRWPGFQEFLVSMGNWGYAGAFFGGMLFVSTFSVTTGVVILLTLVKTLMPWEIALLAGMGAMVGDMLIFKFVRDGVWKEVSGIYDQVDSRHHLIKLLHTRYFLWMLPVLGALIIVSPLPDELGVSLMGISKMKMQKFLPLSFVLNSIGIFGVVFVVKAFS